MNTGLSPYLAGLAVSPHSTLPDISLSSAEISTTPSPLIPSVPGDITREWLEVVLRPHLGGRSILSITVGSVGEVEG